MSGSLHRDHSQIDRQEIKKKGQKKNQTYQIKVIAQLKNARLWEISKIHQIENFRNLIVTEIFFVNSTD